MVNNTIELLFEAQENKYDNPTIKNKFNEIIENAYKKQNKDVFNSLFYEQTKKLNKVLKSKKYTKVSYIPLILDCMNNFKKKVRTYFYY